MSLVLLERVELYKNEDVLTQFCSENSIGFDDAVDIFSQVKKYLWLQNQTSGEVPIEPDLWWLDRMWHCFILFTEDYTDFCIDHFGHYMHHRPSRKSDRDKLLEECAQHSDVVKYITLNRRILARKIVARKLGTETAIKWYFDFPRRFGSAK
jgi:hypothetical protein